MKKILRVGALFTFEYLLFAVYPVSYVWAADPCYYNGEVAQIACLGVYIRNLVGYIFPLAAVVALLFLLFGGIKFITSGGDPKAVETAKKTMTYALFGLALIFSVYAIFWLIEHLFPGLNLTQFNITLP